MKILFVHQGLQSFVQKDLDILRSVHRVRSVQFTGRKGLINDLIRDLWQLWQGVCWCDLTFSWFGKVHGFFAALFSKMLGKKAVVVAGGDDVGMYRHAGKAYTWPAQPVKKHFTYFTSHNVDEVITISKFNYWEALRYAKAVPDRTILIYHGFDGDEFRKPSQLNKENIVVTVGEISFENYDRKGFRLFVESARLIPEVIFLVVGGSEDGARQKLEDIASDNVVFTGPLYGQDLVRILSESKVYVQASEWESFGCAVAEAMLCECVPVVSRRTALPEVVGEAGYYIDNLTAEELSEAIRRALADQEMGVKARARIIQNFSLKERRRKILAVLEGLTSSAGLSQSGHVISGE